MKHIILLILIFITISACSRNSDGGSPPPAPPEGPTETQPQPEQEVAQEESEDEQSEEFVEDGIVEEQIVEDENPIQEKTNFAAPETYGGQLLVSYLEKQTPLSETIQATFAYGELTQQTLDEMSDTISQLRATNNYTPEYEKDVETLEKGLKIYLSKAIQRYEQYEDYIEYGSAAALGVLGGVYSDKILRGLRWVGFMRPKNKSVPSFIEDLGNLSPKALLERNLTRNYPHDTAARGIDITEVPEGPELITAQRMIFQKTGINGLRIHQRKNENYFVAKQLGPDQKWHYFYVDGDAFDIMSRHGQRIAILPQDQVKVSMGDKIREGIKESAPYRYITNNPALRRTVEGTVLGGTIGALTLLSLQPVDTRYYLMDDYLEALESEGIHLQEAATP